MKYIDFKNYEIQKSISEQLRTLAWTLSGIYAYLGVTQDKAVLICMVLFSWFCIMCFSFMVLTAAEKTKNWLRS